MTDQDFVAELGLPFLAHRLRRASEAFVDGYGVWLPEAGVAGPPRGLSTLLLLERNGPTGVMEIASALRLSHPLIIRLVQDMEDAGLVRASNDPRDGRRRVIALTSRGAAQAATVRSATEVMAAAYADVFAEIGVDLLAVVERLELALRDKNFTQRLRQAAQAPSQREPA